MSTTTLDLRAKGPNLLGGLCHCGCGERTRPARHSHAAEGWVRGEPLRFVHGHATRAADVPARGYIVDEQTGCWLWQLHKNAQGYGSKRAAAKMVPAHRWFYEQANGPIPDGLHLDHLCRNPGCVNPDHLEPVTNAENQRRGSHTKLTASEVREIRASAERCTALAARFGVSPCNISKIRLGQIWVAR